MSLLIARKAEGANKTEIARELGLSRPYVSNVLSGKDVPSLQVAAALAKRLGVSLDAFHKFWIERSERSEQAVSRVN